MKNRRISVFGFAFLFVFATAILLDGKYSPVSSKSVTIHIDGIDNNVVASKVEEMVRTIEGVQTVFIDEKSQICMVRYDSGKIDLKVIESQLTGLGIKFVPIESLKILDSNVRKDRKKLLSIKINSASNQ
ncbi:MAG: hypothetical protein L6422_07715 [Candidatus Marinimicrobia bacterium]|nr:hypothetical protein [Candidatus Neomarinimicrobiota bacterium]